MLEIQLNEDNFQYDIFSLVKAFLPNEEIKVVISTEPTDAKKVLFVRYLAEGVEIVLKAEEEKEISESILWNSEERKERKNQLKRLLYYIMSAYAKKELPWGNLTGIRPIKLPLSMLEKGKSKEEIRQSLEEIYCMSRQKADLSLEIAQKELQELKSFDYKSGYSLYVGIPFCPTTCLYCSFTSYPIGLWRDRTQEYLQALFKELEYISVTMAHKRLDTVYIGGGTPTTLNVDELRQLIEFIYKKFDCSNLKEFCVEAGRPDSLTGSTLRMLSEYGIHRISINPQTMNDETLKLIGRQHTVEDIKRSFYMAKEVGLTINMDIILGLPGEQIEHLQHTLSEIKQLNPENLTVHSLALKRAARLNIEKESYLKSINVAPEIMMKEAECMARKMEMAPYYLYRQKNMGGNLENVGYAKEGHVCLYNILIMEEKQTIIGAGAGAMTKYVVSENDIIRVENVKDVTNYVKRVDEMIVRKKEVFCSYE